MRLAAHFESLGTDAGRELKCIFSVLYRTITKEHLASRQLGFCIHTNLSCMG